MLPVHQRLIHWLEDRGDLDRALEFLPRRRHRPAARRGAGADLAGVLGARRLRQAGPRADLIASALPDDPWFVDPAPATSRRRCSRVARRLAEHPLRREIITTAVDNLVNRGGITFAFRAIEETGATPEQIARAFVVAREIFDLPGFVRDVEALDNRSRPDVQTPLYLEFRRLIDRAIRWFLTSRPSRLDVANEVSRFAGVVGGSPPGAADAPGCRAQAAAAQREGVRKVGVPEALALRAASLLDQFSLLDIVDIATDTGESPDVAPLYFVVSERFGIDLMLGRVTSLPRDDRWDALARGALRDDLYAVLESLVRAVIESTDSGKEPLGRLTSGQRPTPSR